MTCYETIEDLPLFRWRKINETNELDFLIVKSGAKANNKLKRLLPVLWDKIYSEFLDTFGINEDFKNIMELRRDILVLKMEIAVSGDRFILNHIRIAEREIEALQVDNNDGSGNSNFVQAKAMISKFMGFPIDEKTTSVKDFYSYKELYLKENKQRVNG